MLSCQASMTPSRGPQAPCRAAPTRACQSLLVLAMAVGAARGFLFTPAAGGDLRRAAGQASSSSSSSSSSHRTGRIATATSVRAANCYVDVCLSPSGSSLHTAVDCCSLDRSPSVRAPGITLVEGLGAASLPGNVDEDFDCLPLVTRRSSRYFRSCNGGNCLHAVFIFGIISCKSYLVCSCECGEKHEHGRVG